MFSLKKKIKQFKITIYLKHAQKVINDLSKIKGIEISVYNHLIKKISLKEQFHASTHTFEEHLIYEHSLKAMLQAYSQKGFHNIEDIISYKDFELILALHDIGKDLAHHYTGTKVNQHAYTIAIIEKTFKALHKENLMQLTKALLYMDALGELLKGKIDRSRAEAIIKSNAKHSGISQKQFFRLLKFYYISDASANDNLMQRIFLKEASGRIVLHPNHPKLKDFELLERQFS